MIASPISTPTIPTIEIFDSSWQTFITPLATSDEYITLVYRTCGEFHFFRPPRIQCTYPGYPPWPRNGMATALRSTHDHGAEPLDDNDVNLSVAKGVEEVAREVGAAVVGLLEMTAGALSGYSFTQSNRGRSVKTSTRRLEGSRPRRVLEYIGEWNKTCSPGRKMFDLRGIGQTVRSRDP